MKKLVWKLVWKIICKWEKIAERNGMMEQADECEDIKFGLVKYKNAMKEKDLW